MAHVFKCLILPVKKNPTLTFAMRPIVGLVVSLRTRSSGRRCNATHFDMESGLHLLRVLLCFMPVYRVFNFVRYGALVPTNGAPGQARKSVSERAEELAADQQDHPPASRISPPEMAGQIALPTFAPTAGPVPCSPRCRHRTGRDPDHLALCRLETKKKCPLSSPTQERRPDPAPNPAPHEAGTCPTRVPGFEDHLPVPPHRRQRSEITGPIRVSRASLLASREWRSWRMPIPRLAIWHPVAQLPSPSRGRLTGADRSPNRACGHLRPGPPCPLA